MSQADWIKLVVGAILTAGLTLGGQLFIARYQHKKTLERERFLEEQSRERVEWDEVRARVKPLMDTAGELTTHLGGWAMNHHADEIKALLRELNTFPAQFTDFPDVRREIWDFQNTAHIILDDQWFFLPDKQREVREKHDMLAPPETPEEQETRRAERERLRTVELPQCYQALRDATDALLKPKRQPKATNFLWCRKP